MSPNSLRRSTTDCCVTDDTLYLQYNVAYYTSETLIEESIERESDAVCVCVCGDVPDYAKAGRHEWRCATFTQDTVKKCLGGGGGHTQLLNIDFANSLKYVFPITQ